MRYNLLIKESGELLENLGKYSMIASAPFLLPEDLFDIIDSFGKFENDKIIVFPVNNGQLDIKVSLSYLQDFGQCPFLGSRDMCGVSNITCHIESGYEVNINEKCPLINSSAIKLTLVD